MKKFILIAMTLCFIGPLATTGFPLTSDSDISIGKTSFPRRNIIIQPEQIENNLKIIKEKLNSVKSKQSTVEFSSVFRLADVSKLLKNFNSADSQNNTARTTLSSSNDYSPLFETVWQFFVADDNLSNDKIEFASSLISSDGKLYLRAHSTRFNADGLTMYNSGYFLTAFPIGSFYGVYFFQLIREDLAIGKYFLGNSNLDPVSGSEDNMIGGRLDPLEANFSATPTSGSAPLTVSFKNTTLGTATNKNWDFGDQSESTDNEPSHTYNSPGNYTVRLTVSNALTSDTKTGTITVTGATNDPPVINITAPQNNRTVTEPSITIKGSASDNDGSISQVQIKLNSGVWQTATGTNSWSKSVSLSLGANTIYAKAKDNNGAWSQEEGVIVILVRKIARDYTGNGKLGLEDVIEVLQETIGARSIGDFDGKKGLADAIYTLQVLTGGTGTVIFPYAIKIHGSIININTLIGYSGEDSYLQLVHLPADGNIQFTTDGRGRLTYTSDLPSIDIPSTETFAFEVSGLFPGQYLIAAQTLESFDYFSSGKSPLLQKSSIEPLIIEIPEDYTPPLDISVGNVTIPETSTTPQYDIKIHGSIININILIGYAGEDSYLQLVYLPPDGSVNFTTDGRGRLTYTSDLPSIDIPSTETFAFEVSGLFPGRYFIAAQALESFDSIGKSPILLKSANQLLFIEIPEDYTPPLDISVGNVMIP